MKANAGLFNLLTVLVLAMTGMFVLWTSIIFANPQVFINPLKPHDDLPVLLPTVPTAAPTASPVIFPTLPRAWTATPTPAGTSALTNTAVTLAVSSPSEVTPQDQSSPTRTPFPTPLAPTATLAPTDLPSRTPTLRPPSPTATHGPYPDLGTDTPMPVTNTPRSGYP